MVENSRVRVSIVGVVCVSLFAALFGRLWYLQMVSDSSFVAQGTANSTRIIQTEAPRGRLLDRNGDVLVDNATTPALLVDRGLEEVDVDVTLGRLAELLGGAGAKTADGNPIDSKILRDRYDDERSSRFEPAIVATDVPPEVIVAVAERREQFPHVQAVELPVRSYEHEMLAAHLLGYVGEINEDELKEREGKGYELSESIGRTGVERAYESFLRGIPTRETVEVDPSNERVSDDPIAVKRGSPGNDVVLTIDANVQEVAEASLAEALAQAQTHQNPDIDNHYEEFAAPAGAVVVLDVTDGSIVAMASNPAYNPNAFIGGIPQSTFDFFDLPESHQPLTNRATEGQYAPGSTFKLITSLAMLQQGLRTEYTPYEDTGSLEIEDQEYTNAGGRSYGVVDLRSALTQSVDTYFYEMGRQFWICQNESDTCAQDGEAIQHVARQFGLGSTASLAISESGGNVPDAAWKRAFVDVLYADEAECQADYQKSCEDLRRENGIWFPGDNINLAVGQGDLLVTPLQLANAYATFANGGTLRRPIVAREVRDLDGRVVRRFSSKVIREVAIDAVARNAIMDGLRGAVADEVGTAYGAFQGFPLDVVPVAGKTGTAQVTGKGDTSLFAAIVPAHQPKYVVVTLVEEAGFGSRVAAPIARRVIEALYGLPLTDIVVPPQEGGSVD